MTLYEGRIAGKGDPLMARINRSLPFDIRLLPYDVATNRAWAGELLRLGIFTEAEHGTVQQGLEEILQRYRHGEFRELPEDEDVHTLVERLLTERLGPAGAKIHTGRSRNDQVVCDLRLYTVDALRELETAVVALLTVLVTLAETHAHSLLAGTTHLQPALPISLSQFLLSLAAALRRDYQRIGDARARTNFCPLGAGAMAGSGFAVDREALARALGFEGVLPNSIDAVSDRDFCQETASACAQLTGHLSRYAEQFVIWANPNFGYVRFSDTWSTGSSMMPQKRNPDAMELIRGKAARTMGAMTTLFAMTKGLPLTYAKDLQEDKEALFDLLDTSLLAVQVFGEALASARFDLTRMKAGLSGDMLATDLADALVRAGVPFRQAHARVGKLVGELEAEGGDLFGLSRDRLLACFPEFGKKPPVLSYEASLHQRSVLGGTAPEQVHAQVAELKAFLKRARTG